MINVKSKFYFILTTFHLILFHMLSITLSYLICASNYNNIFFSEANVKINFY